MTSVTEGELCNADTMTDAPAMLDSAIIAQSMNTQAKAAAIIPPTRNKITLMFP